MRSFSLIFCFGTYGGFRFENAASMKRLVLGIFAFTFITPEFDVRVNRIIEMYEVHEGELVPRKNAGTGH